VSLNRTLGDATETQPPAVGASDATPGAIRIGRFLILEVLGRGSMGVVYAAYDETLDRRVALKVIRRDVSTRPRPS
jgi:serine/threonine protein kinase